MKLKPQFPRFQQVTATVLTAALMIAPAVAQALAKQVQQQQEPAAKNNPHGLYKFKIESELVLINVVARDKQGKPVTDLKAGDFTVLEDGKPQRVTSFDFDNLDTTPMTASSGPSQTSVDGQPAGPSTPSKPILTRKDAEDALSNKRVIVLFFDLSSMNPDETQRAVDAARKYVQNKMTAADMIAIIALASSLRLDQDFTNDRTRLLRVLNRYTHAEGEGMGNGATGDADGIEETGSAYTPDETEYNQFNTDRKLQALQSICQVLSRFNQKKSVIYFSSGMTQTGIENQSALRAAVNQAIKANVAIYTLDSSGLEAQPPGGGAATASLRGTSMYSGAAVQNQLDANFASQETLTTLASDTGGKAFLDTNDLGQVCDGVETDTSVTYVP